MTGPLDPELVAAVDRTREGIVTALGRHHRDPLECDHAHRRYTAACAAAGVRVPPPWPTWPPQGISKSARLLRRPQTPRDATEAPGPTEGAPQ